MSCGLEPWKHAHNSTDACPHPPITNCNDCRDELCSSHIIECEVCGMYVCMDCVCGHYREHERMSRQVGAAA
jgi:hypothetical protein